jgi:hypothetical protein
MSQIAFDDILLSFHTLYKIYHHNQNYDFPMKQESIMKNNFAIADPYIENQFKGRHINYNVAECEMVN